MELYQSLINRALNGSGGGGGGSSDFDIARVTFDFTAPAGYTIDYIGYMASFELDDASLYSKYGETTSNFIDVITYKGLATMTYGGIYVATTRFDLYIDLDSMVLSGSIVYDGGEGLFRISGDCTITAQLTDEQPK